MKKIVFNIFITLIVIITLTSCRTTRFPENSKKVGPDSAQPPTYPVTSNDQPMKLRFVVMADSRGSDNGINLEAVTKTLESIQNISPQPSFAVMPGDLIGGASTYSETKSQFQFFKDTITKFYPINFFYPGFGNHEAVAGINGEKAFEEIFSEFRANFLDGYNKTAYYFDNGTARFYMLNSNHPGEAHIISDTQLNWVNTNIDPSKKHNFYFFHEPAYPTGPHLGSSLDVNKLQRNKLWQIIDSSNSPMAFCGHEHFYTRRHIDSAFDETVNNQSFNYKKTVYQITTGTFGAPVYTEYGDNRNVDVPPIPEYHFAVVDISDSTVQISVYNLEGKIIDRFEQ